MQQLKHCKTLRLLLLFTNIFTFTAYASSGDRMQTEYYFLSIKAEGLHATVKFNNLPLIIHNEGVELTTEKMVTSWLMDNLNMITIDIAALPEQEKITGTLHISLFLHDNSAEAPTSKEVLAELTYPDPDNQVERETTDSLMVEFQYTKGVMTQLWKQAPPIQTLTNSDKQTIHSLIIDLQKALITDGSKAAALQQYKIQEDALAERKDPKKIQTATETTYKWLASQPDVKALPLSVEDMIYTIGGRNNVIFVSRPNFENALQLESEDLFFEVPIYVGKIEGQWTLVR